MAEASPVRTAVLDHNPASSSSTNMSSERENKDARYDLMFPLLPRRHHRRSNTTSDSEWTWVLPPRTALKTSSFTGDRKPELPVPVDEQDDDTSEGLEGWGEL